MYPPISATSTVGSLKRTGSDCYRLPQFTIRPLAHLSKWGNQGFMKKLKKVVVIGGCGHVGLPLGIVFANCGLDVVLLDKDQAKIDTVNKGEMPFMETNALEQLGNVVGKKLVATADTSCLRDSDAAIAVLGTPVDEHLNPTVTDL